MRVNVFLVRWVGGWLERKSSSSIASVGRIEQRLDLGAITSLPEAKRVADGQLDEFSVDRTQTDIEIAPTVGDVPYDDFSVGDTITVASVAHRVLGMTVKEDTKQTGRPIYTPTFNADIILSPEERMFQVMRKMLNGTLGGRSKVAQPVVPIAKPLGRAPIPVCQTDDFDRANNASLGADWDTSGYSTFGTGHIHSNQVSLAGTGVSSGSYFFARRATPLALDAEVTLDIASLASVPFPAVIGEAQNTQIIVYARMDHTSLAGQVPTPEGVYCKLSTATFLSNGGPTWECTVGWLTPAYSALAPVPYYLFEGQPSSLSLRVTGTPGVDLVIEGSVDGAVFKTWTHADIIADGYTDYADFTTYFPQDEYVGFSMYADVDTPGPPYYANIDDDVAVDNFSACPL